MNELHRLDQLLVAKKLVNSRQRAEVLIREGGVTVDGKIIDKPGKKFDLEAMISLIREPMPWVSRAALKILAAIDHWKLETSIHSKTCMDVGASTGGFTQVLLEKGATKVFALDTGHGQLVQIIAEDDRVVNLEKHNIRNTPFEEIGKVDFIVVDVSFISLTLVLPELLKFRNTHTPVLALVKPQFEVGPAALGRNGIVQKESDRLKALETVKKTALTLGYTIQGTIDSPISGGDGNREFLIYLT